MFTPKKKYTHKPVSKTGQRETFRADPKDAGFTQVTTEARIVSKFGWGMTERVEGFGLSKFADSTAKVSKMGWIGGGRMRCQHGSVGKSGGIEARWRTSST